MSHRSCLTGLLQHAQSESDPVHCNMLVPPGLPRCALLQLLRCSGAVSGSLDEEFAPPLQLQEGQPLPGIPTTWAVNQSVPEGRGGGGGARGSSSSSSNQDHLPV
jgi:hypothetical protein